MAKALCQRCGVSSLVHFKAREAKVHGALPPATALLSQHGHTPVAVPELAVSMMLHQAIRLLQTVGKHLSHRVLAANLHRIMLWGSDPFNQPRQPRFVNLVPPHTLSPKTLRTSHAPRCSLVCDTPFVGLRTLLLATTDQFATPAQSHPRDQSQL